MSLYDDLDPMFTPSPEAALDHVAARVHDLRVRRRVGGASALVAVVVVTALASAAFASGGGKHASRVSVSGEATTTTHGETTGTDSSTSTVPPPDGTTTTVGNGSAKTATASSAETTTPVGQVPIDNVALPETTPTETTPNDQITTPTARPADLHFVFSPSHLVIQSGTTATISYTVTNDGDGPGRIVEPGCLIDGVVADGTSVSWPRPVQQRAYCTSARYETIAPNSSTTITHPVVAGLWDGVNDGIVPSPPGETTYLADYCCTETPPALPVTITAPAQVPFSSTFPAQVTVASGQAHTETFTLTNGLDFAVEYVLDGPCMRLQGATAPCGSRGDSVPRWWWGNNIVVGANATVTLVMDLSGTTDFMPPGSGNSALAPGTYQLFGPGGMPLTLTVTA